MGFYSYSIGLLRLTMRGRNVSAASIFHAANPQSSRTNSKTGLPVVHFDGKKIIHTAAVYCGCSNTGSNNDADQGNGNQRKHLLGKGLPKKKPINGVKHTILVASGKGGVGKSTIAVNLAVALKKLEPDKEVGLLDADVFGPSVPLMMNVNDTPLLSDNDLLVPLVNYGVKCISMGNLITESSAAIWRGLLVMSALNKLLYKVDWTPLDYMIIDTPPGTGDTLLSLVQNIQISGAVIVSTGQKASLQVTRRGITMFEKLNVPIIGIVHNMSSIRCENCSEQTSVFGDGLSQFSKNNDVEILSNVPLDPTICECSDNGKPFVFSHPTSLQAEALRVTATKVSRFVRSTYSQTNE